jgi:hypothetical protein
MLSPFSLVRVRTPASESSKLGLLMKMPTKCSSNSSASPPQPLLVMT